MRERPGDVKRRVRQRFRRSLLRRLLLAPHLDRATDISKIVAKAEFHPAGPSLLLIELPAPELIPMLVPKNPTGNPPSRRREV
jgi:hypothetical protein